MQKNSRRVSLEIIRVIALCLVIFNHTGENGFELFRYAQNKPLWLVAVFIDVICKAGVPLFFMVSGALLLGRDESIRDIFVKRILRYIVIIVVFSFMYYIWLYIRHPEYGFSIGYFIKYIYTTPFIDPYWFLYAYVGFLLVLPVLRAIVKSLNGSGYMLLIGTAVVLCLIVVPEQMLGIGHINVSLSLYATGVFYPLVGYYIANVVPGKYDGTRISRENAVIMVFAVINYAAAIFMNTAEFANTGEYSGSNIDAFSLIPALAVFYLAIYFTEIRGKTVTSSIIVYIGTAAFSTYLFEDMLRFYFLNIFKITDSQVAKLLLCIPYTACIIACGCAIAWVMRRIPVVKKLKI